MSIKDSLYLVQSSRGSTDGSVDVQVGKGFEVPDSRDCPFSSQFYYTLPLDMRFRGISAKPLIAKQVQ